MGVIKAVSSKVGIGGIIDYVTKEEKTEEKLLSGLNCQPTSAKDEMQATKELWGKTGGRTYKHFVQSFAPEEDMTPNKAHEIAKQFAEQCPQFKGFEVLIATHQDKDHIHTHFVLNSVSFEDGHKFRMHKSELQEMKDLSDVICSQHGLHITEKGRTYNGAEREETSAYTKETYRLLKKAEQGEVKSYVQDIALSILDCKEQATSREDFVARMQERGVGVDWQDNHKYITFTDLARQEQGEKQCKVRHNKLEKYYNMDFGKESLEIEFTQNARREQNRQRTDSTIDRAREQLEANRGAEQNNNGTATNNIQADIIRRSTERREREATRIEQERARAEAEERAIEQALENARNQARQRSWDMER